MSDNAYVFLCNDVTEQECLDKLLFGGKESYQRLTKNILPGDRIFLYNYQSSRLHGVFKAITVPQMNINPSAWRGRFPWQLKVEWLDRYKPLTADDFDVIL